MSESRLKRLHILSSASLADANEYFKADKYIEAAEALENAARLIRLMDHDPAAPVHADRETHNDRVEEALFEPSNG